jgi:vancomycin aglycone glucosyltransferase
MRALIAAQGSRGDVQPIVALALELRALGHDASLVVPPNFKEWVESFGLTCIPIGPDVRKMFSGKIPARPPKMTMTQRRQLAAQSIREQFQVVGDAARTCDLIVGAGVLQFAARSVAEALGIPFVFAAYCPAAIPSPDHPPPKIGTHHSQSLPGLVNRFFWSRDGRRWDMLFRPTLEEERAKLGLSPLGAGGMQRYIVTDRPWLAADRTLGPAAAFRRLTIVQTGAWMLPARTSLPAELDRFLGEGEPPIYLGFGSMRTSEDAGRMLVEAVRTVGRRAIISQGWANLDAIDAQADCLVISDVDHAYLFPRVAAVVHHGGAGTTTTAALAGAPQAIVPHSYDQYYWAHRVQKMRVGAEAPGREGMTVASLVSALRECLAPETSARARTLAGRVEAHGARIAAQRLVAEWG